MAEKIREIIYLDGVPPLNIFGYRDSNLRLIEARFKANIVARGNKIILEGEPEEVEELINLFNNLIDIAKKGEPIDRHDVIGFLNSLNIASKKEKEHRKRSEIIIHSTSRKPIRPKTKGQHIYVDAMKNNDIVFSIGPAGTGKTYLAVAMAASALKNNDVARIILVRPAVEAGEKLGFLPGDLQDKVDPYLRPVYDALYDLLGIQKVRHLLDNRVIEIAPLAYMRGRTLNHSFIILDEAQNTTLSQMKMFLTRLGFDSKAVITGDITQVDLEEKERSGLIRIQDILSEVTGIRFVYLQKQDVVRHNLVQDIIHAFEKVEKK